MQMRGFSDAYAPCSGSCIFEWSFLSAQTGFCGGPMIALMTNTSKSLNCISTHIKHQPSLGSLRWIGRFEAGWKRRGCRCRSNAAGGADELRNWWRSVRHLLGCQNKTLYGLNAGSKSPCGNRSGFRSVVWIRSLWRDHFPGQCPVVLMAGSNFTDVSANSRCSSFGPPIEYGKEDFR